MITTTYSRTLSRRRVGGPRSAGDEHEFASGASTPPYSFGREWALTLPNARLLTIKDGAHQSFDEFPEIVLPAVRKFVEGNWPEGAKRVTSLNPVSYVARTLRLHSQAGHLTFHSGLRIHAGCCGRKE